MSVTAEQWAQAEAERQRQAEMVQTLMNEVRRLGTEQNNNLQEIHNTASGTFRGRRTTSTGTSCWTRNHRHENREAAYVFR